MKYRQGDVMITNIDSIPDKAIKQPKTDRIVLAYGEATGHAHVIEDATTELHKFDVDLFLKVLNTTKIKHEEHAPIILEPGFYKVIRQREYTPLGMRIVKD